MAVRPNCSSWEEITEVPSVVWTADSGETCPPIRLVDEAARAQVGRVLVREAISAYHVCAVPLPERDLIARIRSRARPGRQPLSSPGFGQVSRVSTGWKQAVVAGIGDDSAVLRIPKNHEMLVTTDLSLEGVHFRREWHPPESVGHRCLARGLSDIAAMGGNPIAVFLSLAVPTKLPQRWLDGFLRGLLRLAAQFDLELAGGDTSQSPGGILADIVVVGSIPGGKAILRSNARAGDRIYVSGALGGSAAALNLLYSRQRKRLRPDLCADHFFPTPQIKLGQTLRKQGIASAMIDISDGFSTDLGHICEESGAGAEIWEDSVPRAKIRMGKTARPVDLHFALHGGEDYQLLFTARKGRAVPAAIGGIAITEVGVITKSKDMVLVRANRVRSKLWPLGWEHFRKSSPG